MIKSYSTPVRLDRNPSRGDLLLSEDFLCKTLNENPSGRAIENVYVELNLKLSKWPPSC